jgi:hypothetical protein
MVPAATKKGGMCLAVPDVCKTPSPTGPIPMPYPNTGMLNTAKQAVMTVLIENKEVVVEDSSLPSSNGDEPGTAGGVVSGVAGKDVTFKTYSSKVFVKGKKGVILTAVAGQNGTNPNAPAGTLVQVAQVKVFFAF